MTEAELSNDKPLLDLLDRYKTELANNTLSWKQRLLLVEMNIKDFLLLEHRELPDNDNLKYLFMGIFVYSQLSSSLPVSLSDIK